MLIIFISLYCPPIFTLDLPYMHEYITRSLHSIFNHHKDIVYCRSSSILISVIRISYRKISLYECPFNIQRRLGLGVVYVTLVVKVSGSSLGKLFYLRFFFILNKKQARRAQENDMIFMCVTKSVKPPVLDRDNGIRQQPPSQFQKQTNCLFCIKLLSENQKEAFRAPYLEKTAEATGVIRTTFARI